MTSTLLLPPSLIPYRRRFSPPRAATTTAVANSPAIIIGGGLAGLAAAVHLHSNSIPTLILESSDDVGGRVRTDIVDVDGGVYLLDRGFQIFLTAYPEARRLLDYSSLNLKPFYPGALVFCSGELHRVADPFRRPLDGAASLTNPVGSVSDKLLIGLSRMSAAAAPFSTLLSADETSIAARLSGAGFSPAIVDRFFRPFLGGIFFDNDLETSSRLLDFVFKCLATGENSLPAGGVAAIPRQLAGRLPPDSIKLNSGVSSISPGFPARVVLESGEILYAHRGVILAVDQPEAHRLLPELLSSSKLGSARPNRSTVCLYFSADRAAVDEPILILNGSGKGIVNNMCFPSNVSTSYSPNKKTLVSVSLIGEYPGRSDEDLATEVMNELAGWFGYDQVRSWKHIRTYRIGFAQPNQNPPTNLDGKDPRLGEGIYVCGDHWATATFDGALVSGRVAAEAFIKDSAFVTV